MRTLRMADGRMKVLVQGSRASIDAYVDNRARSWARLRRFPPTKTRTGA
jgi:hypothetical protein